MGVTIRLSAMMFLQFFIWGAWYVTVGNFMKQNGMNDWVYWAYTVGPIAAIISPFFLGLVADRFFPTERVLSAMHFLGAVTIFCAPFAAAVSPLLFIIVLFLHMLTYMPTLGLTNTLAFHNIENQEKQFPVIRVLGTIGWIVANVVVSNILAADRTDPPAAAAIVLPGDIQFYVTAAGCLALSLYSLTLPHTPPPAAGKEVSVREIIGADALSLLKQPSFAVFILCSFLICIPLAAYYAFAPIFVGTVGDVNPIYSGINLFGNEIAFLDFTKPASVMLYGQITEIVFMLLMPLFFIRLGVKYMLLLGMLAWVLRYALFAGGIENSVVWMVFAGVLLHGICYDFFFVTGFIYTDKKSTKEIRGQAQGLLVFVTQGLGLLIGAQVMGFVTQIGVGPNQNNWQLTWIVPCIGAAAVTLIFFIFFRDDTKASPESDTEGEVAQAATASEMP